MADSCVRHTPRVMPLEGVCINKRMIKKKLCFSLHNRPAPSMSIGCPDAQEPSCQRLHLDCVCRQVALIPSESVPAHVLPVTLQF